MISFKKFLSSLAIVVCVFTLVSEGAQIQLSIQDAEANSRLPARVRVRDAAGKDLVPDGAVTVNIGIRDKWFVSSGQTKMEVPAGKIEIRVEHGPEYSPFKKSFNMKEDKTNNIEVKLKRWINMGERGYLCGENHLHLSPQELPAHLASEGLDFGSSLQWWNKLVYELPEGKDCICKLEYSDEGIPSGICDYEIEHGWGATYVVGQPTELQRKQGGDYANLPTVRDSHKAGALVCYQGGWSREVLFDALLGYVDVVNVCNNNFHRHIFQPRSRYSNLLKVEGFPVYKNTAYGMMRMNMHTYYRLLNCGLKPAAGAGSATGVKWNPAGYNRAYVRVPKNATLKQFVEAWRKGRNFVTCGPMIFLKVQDWARPGDSIMLKPGGGQVALEVEALSDQPLTSLEIVINGKVVAKKRKIDGTSAKLSTKATLKTGSWIIARCTDEDQLLSDKELGAYDSGDHRMGRWPTRLRYAHTSPVYVMVGGKGPRVSESVEEAKKMLDAFELYIKKAAKGAHQEELLQELETARQRLGD